MLTDEQIKALLAGCEGVTIGPWTGEFDDGEFCSYIQAAGLFVARSGLAADAAHIARCDPQTIAELCTRLLEAEARVKVLEEALLDWQSAAVIDVLMEGPRYMGMNRSAAERAWKKTTAALQEQEK